MPSNCRRRVHEFVYAMAEADNLLEMPQVRQSKNHCRRTAALDHDLHPAFRRWEHTAGLPEMQGQNGKTNKFHDLRKG